MSKDELERIDSEVAGIVALEEARQRDGLSLIPSENHTSQPVLVALGSVFTDKYAEGYPGRRYYGGNKYMDEVENLARERAKELFRAGYANVQPLSGSVMNQAVYMAFLEPGDTVLGMEFSHGGHLTHGHPLTHMGKFYNYVSYRTNPETGEIDADELRQLAHDHKPKIILTGHSSYPRDYDYKLFKGVTDEVGAIAMADVSHVGGLIAGGVVENPLDHGFDIMTTTTHKTLRGPRGGLILCKKEYAEAVDKSIFPGLQGGPHMNNIAALAVALKEAATPEFKDYAAQVLKNNQDLADELKKGGVKLVTGGTSNHLIVIDTVESFGLGGKEAEAALEAAHIYVNKQVIPDDPNPPLKPSGIRLGTPAVTTRGMGEEEMRQITGWIIDILKDPKNESLQTELSKAVAGLAQKHPVPGLS